MNNDYKYRNALLISLIIYAIGSFVTIGHDLTDAIIDFNLDLVGLATVILAFLWLKKKILLFGFIAYLIAYNFRLLYNPLFTPNTFESMESMSFLLQLDLLAIILLITGLFDNKYFNNYSKLSLATVITITVLGTITFQVLVRNFG